MMSEVQENALERDMREMSAFGRSKAVTHLCFHMCDYDSLETIAFYPKIVGIVAIVDKDFFVKNRHLDDRHIEDDLPPDIKELLCGELMESHFEISYPMNIFFERIKETSLLYMGDDEKLHHYMNLKNKS